MALYKTKDLSKICKVSRKQLRLYTKLKLIEPTFIDERGWVFFDEYQILKIQKIELLQQMQFTLKDIQIIFNSNLRQDTFDEMVYHWLDNHLKQYKIFAKNYEILIHDLRKNFNLDTIVSKKENFAIFSRNGINDLIIQDIWKMNHRLAKNEIQFKQEKKQLSALRRTIYAQFKNYSVKNQSNVKQKLIPFFEQIVEYLQKNIEYKSILIFLGYLQWICIEPRFRKQMLEEAEFNCGKELWEIGLEWICEEHSY